MDTATTFNASATQSGQGGKVILWSDSVTTFAGTVYARGGELGGDEWRGGPAGPWGDLDGRGGWGKRGESSGGS